jgi:hypothetical protein
VSTTIGYIEFNTTKYAITFIDNLADISQCSMFSTANQYPSTNVSFGDEMLCIDSSLKTLHIPDVSTYTPVVCIQLMMPYHVRRLVVVVSLFDYSYCRQQQLLSMINDYNSVVDVYNVTKMIVPQFFVLHNH